MAIVTGWKFICGDITLDEQTSYSVEVCDMVEDLSMADNVLSKAKVAALQLGLAKVTFCWAGETIDVPTDKIIGFNPFLRADASGAGDAGSADCMYLLDGKEHQLKKKMLFS